jgi:hypothetical protein
MGAPAGCYPRLAVLTGNGRTLVPEAECPRRDSNAHYRSARDRDSYRLVYEDMEPSSGADPDLLPYGGKVTAVCDGIAEEPGLEPRVRSPVRPSRRELLCGCDGSWRIDITLGDLR